MKTLCIVSKDSFKQYLQQSNTMGCELEFYNNADEVVAQVKEYNFQRILLMPSAFTSMDSMLYFHAWLKAINPRPTLVALISTADESEQLMQVFSAMDIFIFNPNGAKIKSIWLASLLTDSMTELEQKYSTYKYKTPNQQAMTETITDTITESVKKDEAKSKSKGKFLDNIFGGLKKSKSNGKGVAATPNTEPMQSGATATVQAPTPSPAPMSAPMPAPTPAPTAIPTVPAPSITPTNPPLTNNISESSSFDTPNLNTGITVSGLRPMDSPDDLKSNSNAIFGNDSGFFDNIRDTSTIPMGQDDSSADLSSLSGFADSFGSPDGLGNSDNSGSSVGFFENGLSEESGISSAFNDSKSDELLNSNMAEVFSAISDKASSLVTNTEPTDCDADMLSSILSEPVVSQPVIVDEADLPDENLKSIRADANTIASSLTVDDVLVSEKPKVITKEVVKEVVREVAGGKGRYASVKSGANPLCVIVTGDRRSGKTTTAIRLSESIARDKVRTLFVDFDIERQNSLLYLNLPGLVEQPLFVQQGVFLCQNEEDLRKAIWTTADISFSSLVSLPTDDTSLAGKQTLDNLEKVAEMLAAQDLFQAVVIDCPLEVLPYVTALLDDCLVVNCIDSDESAISNFIYYFSKLDLSLQKKNRILKSMMLYAVKCKGTDVKTVKNEVVQFKKSLEQFTSMYSQDKMNLPASRIINLNSVDKFIKEKL